MTDELDEEAQLALAIQMSLGHDIHAVSENPAAPERPSGPFTNATLRNCATDSPIRPLYAFLFGSSPDAKDVGRWEVAQFQFADSPNCVKWGLVQFQGGPCGVLAALQGTLLSLLFFAPLSGDFFQKLLPDDAFWSRTSSPNEESVKDCGVFVDCVKSLREKRDFGNEKFSWLSLEIRKRCLAWCLAEILDRAKPSDSSSFVLWRAEIENGAEPYLRFPEPPVNAEDFGGVVRFAYAHFSSSAPGSILSLVLSLVSTRGLDKIKYSDMDDCETPLVARFGHCSQELVNLVLTGEGTSNCFDGVQDLGEGMLLKGVGGRDAVLPVGYLSQLEAMRYLTVGNKYKFPGNPIWVLGSPNHYTTLFALDAKIAQRDVGEELKDKVTDVFRRNGGDPEGGFASVDPCLRNTLIALMQLIRPGDNGVPLLSSTEADEIFAILGMDDIFMLSNLWDCVRSRALSDAPSEAHEFSLFLYDGQFPPGPSLRELRVTKSDLPPDLAMQDDDALVDTIKTRWSEILVEVREPF